MSENFEQLLDQYKAISEKINEEDVSLDESIHLYKTSADIYKKLNNYINKAKLEIENINSNINE